MFIDVSDSVTKRQKVKHAVEGPFRVLGQEQHTVAIQHKDLDENFTADRVSVAPSLAGVRSKPQKSASTMGSQNKNFEWKLWFLHGILDCYLKENVHPEFLLNWNPSYRDTWERSNSMLEEAITGYFARMRKAVPDQYDRSLAVSPRDTAAYKFINNSQPGRKQPLTGLKTPIPSIPRIVRAPETRPSPVSHEWNKFRRTSSFSGQQLRIETSCGDGISAYATHDYLAVVLTTKIPPSRRESISSQAVLTNDT